MIPALIIWFLRKGWPAFKSSRLSKTLGRQGTRIKLLSLLLILCITYTDSLAQEKINVYTVRYKGEDVGTVKLKQRVNADTVAYQIISDVKTRFIFTIRVKSFEESVFQNGKLVFSTVSRTVNGNEKANKQTRCGNGLYTLYGDGKSATLKHEGIAYNMMRLYWVEPLNIQKVYSDNYQQFLVITKIKAHTYKVQLPDGNYNYYSYMNGICSKVEVFSSLYDMQMIIR
jgi:uncharacterized protein DUF6134